MITDSDSKNLICAMKFADIFCKRICCEGLYHFSLVFL